jgi:DNA-binding CsgD family transcriptional regulator
VTRIYLTLREREIILLLRQGFNLREAAIMLHVRKHETIKSQAKRLRAKLGARTSAHLVAIADDLGLLDPKRDNEKE